MGKLDEMMRDNPETGPADLTRTVVRRVPDPFVRDALLAVVDLAEMIGKRTDENFANLFAHLVAKLPSPATEPRLPDPKDAALDALVTTKA